MSLSFAEYVPVPCTHRPSSQTSETQMRPYLVVSPNLSFASGAKSPQGSRKVDGGSCNKKPKWVMSDNKA